MPCSDEMVEVVLFSVHIRCLLEGKFIMVGSELRRLRTYPVTLVIMRNLNPFSPACHLHLARD